MIYLAVHSVVLQIEPHTQALVRDMSGEEHAMNRKRVRFFRGLRQAIFIWSILLAALTTTASAKTLTGRLVDATTNKPAAGDQVVLLDFSNGMQEVGQGLSNSNGSFTFSVDDSKDPRMLRVVHQGATYFKVVPVGSGSVQLNVFDVSARVQGIVVTADVLRVQVKAGLLQAVRLFEVKNKSVPPRTQMSEHNFEFYLPEGARIDHCMARTAGGEPVRAFPLPQKEKNRFAFIFPLRPGETQFQVLFHMPYQREITINPRLVYAVEHFVVMLPKQMQFAASSGTTFTAMRDPRQRDAVVQVASNTTVGQPLTFTLSGTGALADTQNENARGVESAKIPKSSTVPDPGTSTYAVTSPAIPNSSVRSEWYILGGLGLLLAAGTISIARRSTKKGPRAVEPRAQDDPALSESTANRLLGGKLTLNDLKEQFFRLEVDHKQNRISQPEYESAIASFYQNLQRAVGTGDDKLSN
jgi:hypothetical protein